MGVHKPLRHLSKFSASHYKSPPPPPLPEFRVKRSVPFLAVGVDYAGPLTVKQTVPTSSTACSKGDEMHTLLTV